MDDIFGPVPATTPVKENFRYHTVIIKLQKGEGEYPVLEIECHGADKADCACDPKLCQMRETYAMVGWEVIRTAGDIELARLSARMDWSDYEEPWLDVEP